MFQPYVTDTVLFVPSSIASHGFSPFDMHFLARLSKACFHFNLIAQAFLLRIPFVACSRSRLRMLVMQERKGCKAIYERSLDAFI